MMLAIIGRVERKERLLGGIQDARGENTANRHGWPSCAQFCRDHLQGGDVSMQLLRIASCRSWLRWPPCYADATVASW